MPEVPCGKKWKNFGDRIVIDLQRRPFIPTVVALLLSVQAAAQQTVSIPTEDGGIVYADVYGHGDRAVVLAHGGQFNKESWGKQA
jgi:hypothetical protein